MSAIIEMVFQTWPGASHRPQVQNSYGHMLRELELTSPVDDLRIECRDRNGQVKVQVGLKAGETFRFPCHDDWSFVMNDYSRGIAATPASIKLRCYYDEAPMTPSSGTVSGTIQHYSTVYAPGFWPLVTEPVEEGQRIPQD